MRNHLYYYALQPNNYIAEEVLIGYIIINPSLSKNILGHISIEYFFLESHRIIYKYLKKIYYEEKLSLSKLFSSLTYQNKKKFKIKNKLSNFIELIKSGQIFNTSKNTKFYIIQLIKIVDENYTKRIIIQYAYNIIHLTYNHEISIINIYLKSSQYLNYIHQKVNIKNLDNSQNFIGNLVKDLSNNKNDSGIFQKPISSGFQSLDKITSGIPQGDLIVIAGRPSMGKTSLMINIAYYILQTFNVQICIFSLEMTKIQVLQKIISVGSKIPIPIILKGKINKNQWKIIVNICNKLLLSKIYINDINNISIEEINEISSQIAKEINNKILIFIDYLQLIQLQDLELSSRNEELSYITRQLKVLAQSLNIPIVILSQLNRRIETRINKIPLLSDLKESGCISYQLFTYINYINKINLINSSQYIKHLQSYSKYNLHIDSLKPALQYNNNLIKELNLFIEQIFHYKTYYKKYIEITENHPLLAQKNWLQTNKLQQNSQIITCQIKYKQIKEKNSQILITILNNYLVYEISKNEYFNFFYIFLVLHNSIEQDADIIIMLYSNESLNNSISKDQLEDKIIDINVSKNRNGKTGSLRLLFHLPNTIFKDIDQD